MVLVMRVGKALVGGRFVWRRSAVSLLSAAEVEVELLSAGFRAERRKEVKEGDGGLPSAVEYVHSARNCEG